MTMDNMNKYMAEQVLGLSGSYTTTDVRTAFRHAVKNNHPDRVAVAGGDVEEATRKMAEINSAYAYLNGMFDDGRERMDCSPNPAAEKPAEPTREAAPTVTTDIVEMPDDILDPKAAAAARAAAMNARRAAAAANAARKEAEKDPVWYGAVALVVEHFPYRIALVVFALLVMNLVFGVNLFETMGYRPAGWEPTNISAPAFLSSVALFLSSVVNLAVPFITHPLRKLALRGVEKLRLNARAKRMAKLGLAL